MSLDAVVFKSESHFSDHPLRRFFEVDPDTRQLYSIAWDDGITDCGMGEVEALSIRLGNVSTIAFLRETMARVLVAQDRSFLVSVVLASGSGGGEQDKISVNECDRVIQEIDEARRTLQPSNPMSEDDTIIQGFFDDMADLVQAAREENNPICLM